MLVGSYMREFTVHADTLFVFIIFCFQETMCGLHCAVFGSPGTM